jgi:molecular chaperone GrpE
MQNTESSEQDNQKMCHNSSLQKNFWQKKKTDISVCMQSSKIIKRTLKEKNEFYLYASNLMTSMLGVLDDFERALKLLKMAMKQILKVLNLSIRNSETN